MCDFSASPISIILFVLISSRLFKRLVLYSPPLKAALLARLTSHVDYNLLAFCVPNEGKKNQSGNIKDLHSLLMKNPMAFSIASNIVVISSMEAFIMFVSLWKVPRKTSMSEKIVMSLSKAPRASWRTRAACLTA